MKLKTSELIGPALDWAVAECEGWTWETQPSAWFANKPWIEKHDDSGITRKSLYERDCSTNWDRGGPIIERERIGVEPWGAESTWLARIYNEAGRILQNQYGPTPLIAAMRCFVASKLGDEVDIPEELK